MALIGVIMLFNFIALIGSYTNAASDNFARTIDFLVYNGLLGLLLFCILSNKDDFTRALSLVFLTYVVMSKLLSIETPFWYFYDGAHGTLISEYVFSLVSIVAFVAFVVLSIIEEFKGKTFNITQKLLLTDLLAFIYIGFEILAWCLGLAYYSVFNAGWVAYMNITTSCIFIPCLIALGYFMYRVRFVEAPQDEA